MDDSQGLDEPTLPPSRPRTVFDGFRQTEQHPRPIADVAPRDVPSQPHEISNGIVAYELEPLDEDSGVEEDSWRPSKGSRVFRLVVKSLLIAAPIGIIIWGFIGLMTGARWDYILLTIALTTAVLAMFIFFPMLAFTNLDFFAEFLFTKVWSAHDKYPARRRHHDRPEGLQDHRAARGRLPRPPRPR